MFGFELNSDDIVKTAEKVFSFIAWIFDDVSFAMGAIATVIILMLLKLIFKHKDELYSQLTLLLINLFSDVSFHWRYKKHIIFEHRVFNVRGLRTQGTFTLEVEKVYVGLKIAPSANPNKANSITHHEALEGNRPIWDFLQQGLKILAVIGAPGCGKSTLLQHIALAFAANKHRSHSLKAATPIFLFLREHIDKIVTDEINLADLAQAHFKNEKRYPHLNPPEKWFANKLANGKAIVLLDGLDEVADVEKRKKVSAWVENQIIAYRDCPFIVTSRPQGYLAAPLQQAHRLEIQPFSWSQVKEFAHSWYFQNEILSFGKKDEGVVNRAKQGAEDLLMRLQKMPALNVLTVNPLLLTMIAMVHRYRGQLPGRRVELYSEICDVLLGHWRAAIGVQDSLTAIQKRVALQPLAAAMMQRNTREISTEDAVAIITEPLKQVGLTEQQAGVPFLKDVEAGSGLLAEQENGIWRFAHLSFQEYLTACYFVERNFNLKWQILVNKSWWHETIKLYIAQADASKIIEACLQQGSLASLTLASESIEEALKLPNEIRQKFWDVLNNYLESNNKSLSRLAAEVRLEKRLKNLHRINDNVAIDMDFISCAEYQLFLDDSNQDYQPAHWPTKHFPQGTAKQTVLGTRAADAKAFCQWLSQKTGSNYRLPTPEEIRRFPTELDNQDHAVWCRQKDEYDLIWQRLKDEDNCIQNLKSTHSLEIKLINRPLKFHKYQLLSMIIIYDYCRSRSEYIDFDNFDCDFISHDLSLCVNPTVIYTRNAIFACVRDLNCARSYALDLDLDIDLSLDLIHHNNSFARTIEILEGGDSKFIKRLNTLLKYVLNLIKQSKLNRRTIRNATRKITLLELETVLTTGWTDFCETYELKSELNKKTTLMFWKKHEKIDTEILREALLVWFWTLKIIDARIEGKIGAWEGIRIVRERKE